MQSGGGGEIGRQKREVQQRTVRGQKGGVDGPKQGQWVWRMNQGIDKSGSGKEQRMVTFNKETRVEQGTRKQGFAEEIGSSQKKQERFQLGRDATEQWAKRCIVGESKSIVSEENVKNMLESHGHIGFKIAKLTESTWIMEHENEEARVNLLEEEQEWMEEYFHFLKPWEEKDINGRRSVWIGVYGVPLHGWKKETFLKLGNNVGKSIEVHEETVERKSVG